MLWIAVTLTRQCLSCHPLTGIRSNQKNAPNGSCICVNLNRRSATTVTVTETHGQESVA